MNTDLIEAVARAVNNVYADHELVPYRLAVAASRAALSAIEASGYTVAPAEPTEEMAESARNAIYNSLPSKMRAKQVYTAMLSARPKVTP